VGETGDVNSQLSVDGEVQFCRNDRSTAHRAGWRCGPRECVNLRFSNRPAARGVRLIWRTPGKQPGPLPTDGDPGFGDR
jgi:hypothetical protein